MICQSCRAFLRAAPPGRFVPSPTSTARFSSLSPRSVRPTPTATRVSISHHVSQLRTAQRSYSSSTSASTSTDPPTGTISSGSSSTPEPPSMTQAESAIAALLSSLEPTQVLVQDVSGGCGSMYAIDITSAQFKGKTILKQQRMVNAALGEVVKSWHGVQIRTAVPAE